MGRARDAIAECALPLVVRFIRCVQGRFEVGEVAAASVAELFNVSIVASENRGEDSSPAYQFYTTRLSHLSHATGRAEKSPASGCRMARDQPRPR